MGEESTVQLKLTKQELGILVQAFGEVNVAVKFIDEVITPLKGKLEEAAGKFAEEHSPTTEEEETV